MAFGKYTYPTGDVYEGDWQADQRHGKGKYFYADLDVYEGDYQADMIKGKGKLTYADGDVYEGDYQVNLRHGKGKFTYADGDVYEGDYQANLRHGKGKYTCADGDVYEGDYQVNLRHGKGKFTYADGSVYEGDYQAYMMHGKGKYTNLNGETEYDGMWVYGDRAGLNWSFPLARPTSLLHSLLIQSPTDLRLVLSTISQLVFNDGYLLSLPQLPSPFVTTISSPLDFSSPRPPELVLSPRAPDISSSQSPYSVSN
eukprot:g6446.t1